jgi:hypothetical protein
MCIFWELETLQVSIFVERGSRERKKKMYFCMWLRKVPKWPWFWAEVAVKACQDLATPVKQ